MHVKTIILGGGIAGLSTAYHLSEYNENDYLVLEKEPKPGGLCRSIYHDGFTFDYGGHLLHLHTPYGKALIEKLLFNNLNCITRKAWIYTGESKVPYPFQSNLYALPPQLRDKCIEGLIRMAEATTQDTPNNFEDWCIHSFGKGIYEAFMRPYNTKLWGCEPRTLTTEWCGKFVPTPSVDDIKDSVLKKINKEFGYNPSFYYPKKNGCGALIDALLIHIKNISTETEIIKIDILNKKVITNGAIISYDYLVNTLPLSRFLGMVYPSPLAEMTNKLRCQQVTVLLLAVKGEHHPFSWIYFPDKEDPFYRVGMQSSFSSTNAPKDCFSYYVELPGLITPSLSMEKTIIQAIIRKGLITNSNDILFYIWVKIPYAYVIYDNNRTSIVNSILKYLNSLDCFCAGRYGLWEYSFMEKALIQGKVIASMISSVNNDK